MRGTAATGWGLLIGALALAALLAIGLYAWDSNARSVELALRPQPVAPFAGTGQTAKLVGGAPASSGARSLAGDPAAGQRVFLVWCNACHPGASAGVGPALRGPQFAERYPDDGPLTTIIRQGAGSMRPFPPDHLSDQDLANTLAYLRGL